MEESPPELKEESSQEYQQMLRDETLAVIQIVLNERKEEIVQRTEQRIKLKKEMGIK